MSNLVLSYNTRKALCVHLGEPAGKELAAFLDQMAVRLANVEQGKMDVIPIVPTSSGAPQLKVVRHAA